MQGRVQGESRRSRIHGSVLLQTSGRGMRMINTRVVLSEAEWIVLGGIGTGSVTEDDTRFYAAIRIKTRG
jgi:hypothetical protein